MGTLKNFIKKECVLFIFLVLLLILSLAYPSHIPRYPSFIDWNTVIALTGLLLITTGIRESGYFNNLSMNILKRIDDERTLAIFLILFSAFLSTFLTNDVSLFIVIPLTLSIQSLLKNDISKLIIFEAISVNVGSALTPIGNPQNIFIWHKWGVSFLGFMLSMLPLVLILLTILILFAFFIFPKRRIEFHEAPALKNIQDRGVFILSIALLILYIAFIEMKIAYMALPFVFLLYLAFNKRVLLKTDWILLLIFIVIFIDFNSISNIPIIYEWVSQLNLQSPQNVFLFSALSSQLISNVPATVFISKFSNDWSAIAYGVNVGGNGLVIGSLANIIALRMVKGKKIWANFHKYSLPYFFITLTLILLIYLLSP